LNGFCIDSSGGDLKLIGPVQSVYESQTRVFDAGKDNYLLTVHRFNENEQFGAYEAAPPDAAALFESLRAYGYSTESAIADLIDNSIAARATQIDIQFDWKGKDSWAYVLDNGTGMTETELSAAMRPGSQHPSEVRRDDDLGRFGLGMKTASVSQCKNMSVISKKDGSSSARRWDLGYINATNEWRLLKALSPVGEELSKKLYDREVGTLVVWEQMDRLVGEADEKDRRAHDRFLAAVRNLESHLAMVFHRYMSGRDRIVFTLNGQNIEPWDPFLIDEPATQNLPTENLEFAGSSVIVAPSVLPHHSRISSEKHELSAGPLGWNAHQGFYIYRNRRLLVAGTWLGMGIKQEEHYKLARIRVDIGNDTDEAWGLDVRKSRATPPGALKEDFVRIARATRRKAVEVYRHRGKSIARASSAPHVFLWKRRFVGGRFGFELERKHPLVRRAVAASQDRKAITALINHIEQSLPYQDIWINTADYPDGANSPYAGTREQYLYEAAEQTLTQLLEDGLEISEAFEQLSTEGVFSGFPEVIQTLAEKYGVAGMYSE